MTLQSSLKGQANTCANDIGHYWSLRRLRYRYINMATHCYATLLMISLLLIMSGYCCSREIMSMVYHHTGDSDIRGEKTAGIVAAS